MTFLKQDGCARSKKLLTNCVYKYGPLHIALYDSVASVLIQEKVYHWTTTYFVENTTTQL